MNAKTIKLYKRIHKSYKTIVITIVFVIIFVVFATVTNYISFRDQLIENQQEQLLTIAKSTAKQLENFMNGKVNDVSVLEQIIIDDHFKNNQKHYTKDFISSALDNYLKTQLGEVYQLQFYNTDALLVYDTRRVGLIEKSHSISLTTYNPHRAEPYIGDIFTLPSGELAIDIIDRVDVKKENIGYLRMILKISDIYKLRVAEIKIGKKGYASVKDSKGILIMHPNSSDIGKDVLEARRAKLPDQDWSELEALLVEQKKGVVGTGVYHSYWYYDTSYERIKKFTAFAPAFIGNNFWIVTVPKDYNELSAIASRYLYTNVILAGVIPLLLGILLVYLMNLKKNLAYLESEQQYIEEVEQLNKELANDIEKRKELEKALYASRERFKQLFNAGSDLIFVLHVSDNHRRFEISQVNDIACQRLGLARKDILGTDFRRMISDITSNTLEKFVMQLAGGEENIYETALLLDSGKTIPVEISAQFFKLEDQRMMMLMTRDITRKKAEEAKLEKQQAMLIYKFRLVAMGEMIANIAHQWRQPLGRLSLMIANLEDAYIHDGLDEGYLNEVVERSNYIIQDMSGIIDEFRYFFNPINEKAYFDPVRQIQISLEMIKDRLSIDEVIVEIKDATQYSIYGYPNQFSQGILNILNNSLDAMTSIQNKQRLININLDWWEKGTVKISIWNNGDPLPKGVEAKVFDPYFSTKQHKDGTGIGLYMTKMIIETNFEGEIKMFNISGGVVTEIILVK